MLKQYLIYFIISEDSYLTPLSVTKIISVWDFELIRFLNEMNVFFSLLIGLKWKVSTFIISQERWSSQLSELFLFVIFQHFSFDSISLMDQTSHLSWMPEVFFNIWPRLHFIRKNRLRGFLNDSFCRREIICLLFEHKEFEKKIFPAAAHLCLSNLFYSNSKNKNFRLPWSLRSIFRNLIWIPVSRNKNHSSKQIVKKGLRWSLVHVVL